MEFWFVDKWITPLLPSVGLPNLAAVILFGAALAALLIWRNHRRTSVAEKRPWRDVIGEIKASPDGAEPSGDALPSPAGEAERSEVG